MTYKEFVLDRIRNTMVGEPIYLVDIAHSLARQYLIGDKEAKAATSVAVKRIIDEKLFDALRFYRNGIYYVTKETPFGDIPIDKELLIRRKYILSDAGYESGYSFLYEVGLTTQMPCNRVIVTNKAKGRARKDELLGVFVRPPKTKITPDNKMYLQFLDVLELVDNAPIDCENPYMLLSKYMRDRDIRYDKLLSLADKFYGKKTICQIARIASKGDCNDATFGY